MPKMLKWQLFKQDIKNKKNNFNNSHTKFKNYKL